MDPVEPPHDDTLILAVTVPEVFARDIATLLEAFAGLLQSGYLGVEVYDAVVEMLGPDLVEMLDIRCQTANGDVDQTDGHERCFLTETAAYARRLYEWVVAEIEHDEPRSRFD